MIEGLIFGGIIFVVVALVILFGIGPLNVKGWVTSKEGQGAVASMLLGIAVVTIVGTLVLFLTGLFSSANAQSVLDNRYGHFVNHVYVFAGIDYTKKVSPQCVAGSVNDNLTSNMGMGANLWQSPSRRVHLDLQWTHHSCVLGVDRNSYDGFGIRTTLYPWVRSPEPFKFSQPVRYNY